MANPSVAEPVRQDNMNLMYADTISIPGAINEFSFSLYDQIRTRPGNLVFSPYSISCALAMTWAGAGANTAMEMSRVLHFNNQQGNIHEGFKSLFAQLEGVSDPEMTQLAIADALWAQKDYAFLGAYIDLAEEFYGAGIRNLDFTEPASCEQSRQVINQWVEEHTNHKIVELIGQGMLNPLTRLVITNAIWFNGKWKYPFDEQNTSVGDFKVMKDQTAAVSYMNQQSLFGYYSDNDFQAIALPYKGNEINMLVVLPREQADLQQAGTSLTSTLFYHIVNHLVVTGIRISVPKFKSETEIHLNKPLQSLGMQEAFSRDADFSGMTGNKDLFIDFVIHKAFIDIYEQGTEAAAATGVGMALKSAYIEPVEFIADHPFYYFIFHRDTKLILFSGRFVKP